ncbi:MAG: LacI family DNA-binding transcriptional regulator, partial [Christensenellaceae bacterium]
MSARGKRATIKDVAAFAGVSVTTVSFVLNGRGGSVPERTAERVRAAAATLGYRPDFAARSMIMRRTNLVGVLVPDISNGFFAEMVGHIQRALAACGYDVILCNGGESFE